MSDILIVCLKEFFEKVYYGKSAEDGPYFQLNHCVITPKILLSNLI